MYRLILHLFLWWWPKLPVWLRYSICGLGVLGAIISWILLPEVWPAWILLIVVMLGMSVYGEPSEAEKKGYHF